MSPRDRPRLHLELPTLDPRRETDSVRRTNALVAEILAARFAIVEASEADLVVAGGLAPGRLAGPPRLVFPHGALGDPAHWLLTLPELRVCDTLALASRSDAAIVERFAGELFCRRVSLPLFVDTKFFLPDAGLRLLTRRRHGLSENTPLLLAVSSLDPQKNIAAAIDLLAEIRRTRADVELAIVGGGSAAEQSVLEDLAQTRGLGRAVRFLGSQSPAAVRDFYRAADLLVHLTVQRKESFGLVPVEAQACALPVLASAWGGVRDTVLAGETGFYAPTYLGSTGPYADAGTLAGPALALLGDRREHTRFGERGRRWAVERFSIEAFATRLDAVLDAWWLRRPATPDQRRIGLSRAADPLLVAFAELAARYPGEDSRALSDRLAQSEAGARAQRLLFECMVSSRSP